MFYNFHLSLQAALFACVLYIPFNGYSEKLTPDQSIIGYIISLAVLWLVLLWLTHIHKPKFYQRQIKYVLAPYLKFVILLFILNNILIITWRLGDEIGSLLNICILQFSVVLLTVYSLLTYIYCRKIDSVSAPEEKKSETCVQKPLIYNPAKKLGIIANKELHNLHYFNAEIIKQFVQDSTESSNVTVFKSHDPEIENGTGDGSECCIIDDRINDFSDINKKISSAYRSLVSGGYAFFVYEELEAFEKRYLAANNSQGKKIKKLFYYLFYRAFPKIPYINRIYLICTQRKGRVISKAEVWGRLYYHGFELVQQVEANGLSYVLAQKLNMPSSNPNPSFFPIIKLNRVGLYGEIIKIHKIRSMYPYSEYLQKKVHDDNKLNSTGKFSEDYRITKPGKIYRKYWIDELPQFLDWLRGEIKLVGIRALSQQYFALYPQEYQNTFIKVKPGIVSPIFDENTDGFQDIIRIEMEYLTSYLKSPWMTDIRYFINTFFQIISGVRSK